MGISGQSLKSVYPIFGAQKGIVELFIGAGHIWCRHLP
jgi:hypothetical protein